MAQDRRRPVLYRLRLEAVQLQHPKRTGLPTPSHTPGSPSLSPSPAPRGTRPISRVRALRARKVWGRAAAAAAVTRSGQRGEVSPFSRRKESLLAKEVGAEGGGVCWGEIGAEGYCRLGTKDPRIVVFAGGPNHRPSLSGKSNVLPQWRV